MPAQRCFYLFGVGSFGGFFAVLLHWLFMTLYVDLPFVEFTPTAEIFYSAIVWGGVGALVYLFKPSGHWWLVGIIAAIIPTLLFLAQDYGVFTGNFFNAITSSVSGGFWHKVIFREESWAWLTCFMAAWGLFTSHFSSK